MQGGTARVRAHERRRVMSVQLGAVVADDARRGVRRKLAHLADTEPAQVAVEQARRVRVARAARVYRRVARPMRRDGVKFAECCDVRALGPVCYDDCRAQLCKFERRVAR